MFTNINSPLEQFYVIPLIKLPIFNYIITNELVIMITFFLFFILLFFDD